MLGHVGEQRHVAVGQGGDDEPLLQAGEARGRVGPGIKTVPGQVEVGLLLAGEAGDAHFLQKLLQGHAVQGIQLCPWKLPLAHLVHEGAVLAAPPVGEALPVRLQSLGLSQAADLGGYTGAPVHHGAEYVEYQRPDLGYLQFSHLPSSSHGRGQGSSGSGP